MYTLQQNSGNRHGWLIITMVSFSSRGLFFISINSSIPKFPPPLFSLLFVLSLLCVLYLFLLCFHTCSYVLWSATCRTLGVKGLMLSIVHSENSAKMPCGRN